MPHIHAPGRPQTIPTGSALAIAADLLPCDDAADDGPAARLAVLRGEAGAQRVLFGCSCGAARIGWVCADGRASWSGWVDGGRLI